MKLYKGVLNYTKGYKTIQRGIKLFKGVLNYTKEY